MSRTVPTAFLLAALSLTIFLGYARTSDAQASDENSKIQIGMAIAPVPLNVTGKNRSLVWLGSYIVNAQGGCNDCHTAPNYAAGGDPFLGQPTQVNVEGYLAGGIPFGPFVSRNLTPNGSGRPANLTLEGFIETLRTGRDLKHREPHVPSADHDLLQVMPWPVYGQMTDRDLKAMYEYLRSIPCIGSPERCAP
jgi:hypothetical protein